jgi:hypothetical protein
VGKPSEVRELIRTRFTAAEKKEEAEAQLSSLGSMLLGDE